MAAPDPVAGDDFRGSSRYELLVKIGTGGSASVYIGRVTGSAGFSRLVAVKRPHPHLAHDPAVERMMTTEARLASGLNHANVVAVQDVERIDGELLLVLDYVEGASLSELLEAGVATGRELPSRVAIRIALDACAGLSTVHEIEGRDGRPVGFLHRDVSPQNILVGVDGTARITDFGLAKHQNAGLSKATGTLQGKLAYLAPEVIDEGVFSVRSDIFAMGVVIWEALAKRRLFRGDSWADTVRKVGLEDAPPLSSIVPALGARMDGVVAKALDKVASRRHATVRELSDALESIAGRQNLIATSSEVASYVRSVVGDALQRRREIIRSFDRGGAAEDVLSTATLSRPHPMGRAAAAQPAPAAGVAAGVSPALSPVASAAVHYAVSPVGAAAWSTPLDLTPTEARTGVYNAPVATRPAPLPPPAPAAGRVMAPPPRRSPPAVRPPEPPTPQTFTVELAPDDVELCIDDDTSTLDAAPRAIVPAWRPAPEAPPVAMSSFLHRQMPRIEVREVPCVTYPNDTTDGGVDPYAARCGAMSPSRWDRDPLAPWVPPTAPPPPPEPVRFQVRERKAARLLTLGAAAGAAVLMALVPSLLAGGPAAGGAPTKPAAAAVAAQPAAAQAAAPERKAKEAKAKETKADETKADPSAATKKAGAALTPDALPDAEPGGAAATQAVAALTPDALPDAASATTRAAQPRAAATPRKARPASQQGVTKKAGGRRSRPNPYR